MFNPKKILFLISILIPLCFTPMWAQTATATLSGTVEDQNGAAIPSVAVTVENVGTRLKRTATTNDSGGFTVPLLPPGEYSVSFARDGFTQVEVSKVVLDVGDQKALRVALKVGDVKAAIEVRPDETLVNMSPAVTTTIDRTFVSNLPLNGRSFQSLILLTPGVVLVQAGDGTPGEFSVNGQRQNTNYFTVDGISANTGIGTNKTYFSQQAGGSVPNLTALGTTASLVSVDALEEFKIQTSGYSAEYGRQPGGQVQLVTRSGGNEFHGTAFEYVRNDAFDARDWFANANRLPKAPLRQNQFGGTFSGPVILPQFGEGRPFWWKGKDKTFFFFSYEGQRLLIPAPNPADTVVPALWLRSAAALALRPFLNAYPLPTGPEIIVDGQPTGTAPFLSGYSNPSRVDAYSIRVDHTVNNKLSLFGRYAQTPSSSLVRNLSQLQGTVSDNRTLTLGSTLSITPRLSNEIKFNWTSSRSQKSFTMDSFGGATPTTVDQLIAPYSGPEPKYVSFYWGSGFGTQVLLGDFADNYQRQLNIVDNLTWVKGNHLIKFGVDWRHLAPVFGPYAYAESVSISYQYLDYAHTISNLISGMADGVFVFANKGAHPIYDNFSAYGQDTWKVSPRLTLDLGLRWEVNPAPHDANGVQPVLITGVNQFDVSKAAFAPPGTPFYKTIYTAFAPRFGVAYQLNQKSERETVLRGGFGVYYDLGSETAVAGFSQYPFSSSTALSNVSFPLSSAQAVQPAFPTVGLPFPDTLQAINPNLKLPYTLQWNVSVERALGNKQAVTVSYVASAGRRLTITQTINSVPSNQIYINPQDSYRSNPNFYDIAFTRNAATSDYQSLQAQYQRRLSRGLQVLANYTWSRAMDQASTSGEFQATLDRSYAAFDVRHNFSAAVTYDMPKLKGNGFTKAIANGWSLDSIFFARSGLPLDVTADSTTLSNGNNVVIRPDLVPGVPVWIKDPTVAGGQRLNPSAFALPPFNVIQPYPTCPQCTRNIYERPGTLTRNSIRLPGIYQINMDLRRQFSLGERLKLQLKAEVFNVLNHPLFSFYWRSLSPASFFGKPRAMLASVLGGGGYGLTSLYQLGGPRSIQFSARLSF